jgi:hypothetical protein
MNGSAYVYAIVVDGAVRYIGKGQGDRVSQHVRKAKRLNRRRLNGEKVHSSILYNRLAKRLREGAIIATAILESGLSECQGLEREKTVISSFPKEQLWNRNEGGPGPTSETAKTIWQDPKVRTNRLAACRRRDNSAAIEANKNPEKIARQIATIRQTWKNPEANQRKIEAMTKTWKSPEYRDKISAARKAKWADPAYKQFMCIVRKEQWARRKAMLQQ